MDGLKDQIKSLLSRAINSSEAKEEAFEEEKEIAENEDKRKLIDEIGGILKDKVDEEVWRTVIGKLEKIAYEPSEETKADNKKAKNEEDIEEKDDEEEIVENKKCKKAKNSMDDVKKAVFGGKTEIKRYISSSDRIELGNKY